MMSWSQRLYRYRCA